MKSSWTLSHTSPRPFRFRPGQQEGWQNSGTCSEPGGLGPALALIYPSNPFTPPGLSFLSQKMGLLRHAWGGGPRQ